MEDTAIIYEEEEGVVGPVVELIHRPGRNDDEFLEAFRETIGDAHMTQDLQKIVGNKLLEIHNTNAERQEEIDQLKATLHESREGEAQHEQAELERLRHLQLEQTYRRMTDVVNITLTYTNDDAAHFKRHTLTMTMTLNREHGVVPDESDAAAHWRSMSFKFTIPAKWQT